MTPQQQRIAIAKACGWTTKHKGLWVESSQTYAALPDYLNDLNACHEMEKVLTKEQHIDHMEWLGMCSDDYGQKVWAYVHATAAQRSKAFLQTLGLWQSTPTQPQ